MNSPSPNKILVVGPNWVGDMVMAQSLFMVLLQDNPGVRIDVLAPAWTLPVLDYMPEVCKGIEIPLKRGELGIGTRYRLSKSLAGEAYDQVILLPNSLKSVLIPFFAGIPRRTGFLGEQRWGLLTDVRRLDKRILRQTVQRFVALAGPVKYSAPPDCPVPRLIVANDEIRRTMDGFSIDDVQGKVLVLCPGAEYGPAKTLACAPLCVPGQRPGSARLEGLAARVSERPGGLPADQRRNRRSLPELRGENKPQRGDHPDVSRRRRGEQRFRTDAHCRGT